MTEQIIFPEIDIDKVNKIQGMDITFVTSAKTDEEAMKLLRNSDCRSGPINRTITSNTDIDMAKNQ